MKTSYILIQLFIAFCLTLKFSDLPNHNGHGELNDQNFNEFIDSNKYVLVLFHSLSCGHSIKAMEYYTKLSQKLSESDLRLPLTTLDVDQNQQTAASQGIKAIPTLIIFTKGYPIKFKSTSITPNVVFEWVTNVLANKFSDELKNLDEIEEIEELSVAGILYCPKDDVEQFESFNHVAGNYDEVPFYFTHNKKIAKKLGVEGTHGFILLRKFDDGKKIFSGNERIPIKVIG